MASLPAAMRAELRPIDHVSEEDVRQACYRLWVAGDRWAPPRRNAATICLLAFSKLTVAEVLSLTLEDAAKLYLPPLGWEALDHWLTHRRRWTCHWIDTAPLLCTCKTGTPRPRRQTQDDVTRAFRHLGVNVTPSVLKRSEPSTGRVACPETLRRRLERRRPRQPV